MFSFNWTCQKCDTLTRNQNELIKYAIIIKKIKEKLKTRSSKIKKSLVENKIVIDINLYNTGNLFPPVFFEITPELREIRKNSGKVQKFTDIFSKKKYIFKVVTVKVLLYLLKNNWIFDWGC